MISGIHLISCTCQSCFKRTIKMCMELFCFVSFHLIQQILALCFRIVPICPCWILNFDFCQMMSVTHTHTTFYVLSHCSNLSFTRRHLFRRRRWRRLNYKILLCVKRFVFFFTFSSFSFIFQCQIKNHSKHRQVHFERCFKVYRCAAGRRFVHQSGLAFQSLVVDIELCARGTGDRKSVSTSLIPVSCKLQSVPNIEQYVLKLIHPLTA